MTIVPDTKDWSWVADRECPECGFDASAVPVTEVGGMLRENATEWQQVLAGSDVAVRPAPNIWSPLEYACHVRDLHRVMAQRAGLMLTQTQPDLPDWDQDSTAVAGEYGDAAPGRVAEELSAAADRSAEVYAGLTEPQWRRDGRRTDGVPFTVGSLARYQIHDVVHHLYDAK